MPLTDRSQAKESGFAQVRAALQKFQGTVTSAEFGQWGGKLIDEDTGNPVPPREFLEISCVDVQVLEVTEELSMPIEEWNFRVNCSEFNGSFWIERFLEATDRFKVLVPEGLINKRVTWERVTLEAVDKKGVRKPKFDATNFIVAAIEDVAAAPKPAPAVVAKPVAIPVEEVVTPEEVADPMVSALNLAVGKTEAQFRMAIGLDPQFAGSPLLSLAKAGAITQALVNEGKLVLVKDGAKEVYQIPE